MEKAGIKDNELGKRIKLELELRQTNEKCKELCEKAASAERENSAATNAYNSSAKELQTAIYKLVKSDVESAASSASWRW